MELIFITSAIILTVLASLLWGVTNHIDKFLINGIDKNTNNIKTLLIFSTFIAGIVFSPLWLILGNFSVSISFISLLSVFIGSLIYVLATYLYFKALTNNDASIVVVMFQLISVFSYILALILFKENLTIRQIIGSLIIILSSVIISLDHKEKNKGKKFAALILMSLSSLCFSIYFILFDIAIRNSSYYASAFWLQIGFLGLGIIFLCIKSFRENFIQAIKNNGKRYLKINVLNEAINLSGNLLVNYANLTIPIALANVLNGFQGMFVFILGIIGVIFLPKYFQEDLRKEIVIKKTICIILSIIGLIILVS